MVRIRKLVGLSGSAVLCAALPSFAADIKDDAGVDCAAAHSNKPYSLLHSDFHFFSCLLPQNSRIDSYRVVENDQMG
ncbi:hypothetical protein WMF26_49210 [Sorangium sp. So ce185]|uniref:hypothetical protein n=1 Tax=Sorangium sp. So ce185 TaxID=3133287 RepID=UPI003F5E75C1